MSDEPVRVEFNKKEFDGWLNKLEKLGADTKTFMQEAMDDITTEMANHMKREHFFVGTGKNAEAKAEANVFTFRNPDGTPRFKVRTSNLLKSIQHRGARRDGYKFIGNISIGAEYAEDVEKGRPGARAFPFIAPAAEYILPAGRKLIETRIKKLAQ